MSGVDVVADAQRALWDATLAEVAAVRQYLASIAADERARAGARAARIAARIAARDARQAVRAGKLDARRSIITAANTHQRNLNLRYHPYTARTIQQAVCVARRNRLVKPAVLTAAGYNA